MSAPAMTAPPLASRAPFYNSLFCPVLFALVWASCSVIAPDFAMSSENPQRRLPQADLDDRRADRVLRRRARHRRRRRSEEGRPGRRQGAGLFRGHDDGRARSSASCSPFSFAPGHGMNIDTVDARRQGAQHLCRQCAQAAGRRRRQLPPQHHPDHLVRRAGAQRRAAGAVLRHPVRRRARSGRRATRAQQVTSLIEAVSTVLFRAMGLIVRLAPLGVLGAVAYTVGRYGVGSLKQLVSLVALFYVAVALFVLVVLGAVMRARRAEHLQIPRLSARGTDDRAGHRVVRRGAAADHAQARTHGREEFGRRPRHPDRLFVQPRRVLDLSDARGGVHRAGDQHAAVARRSPAGARRLAGHVEGRAWRAGLGDRDPGGDAQRGAGDSRASASCWCCRSTGSSAWRARSAT